MEHTLIFGKYKRYSKEISNESYHKFKHVKGPFGSVLQGDIVTLNLCNGDRNHYIKKINVGFNITEEEINNSVFISARNFVKKQCQKIIELEKERGLIKLEKKQRNIKLEKRKRNIKRENHLEEAYIIDFITDVVLHSDIHDLSVETKLYRDTINHADNLHYVDSRTPLDPPGQTPFGKDNRIVYHTDKGVIHNLFNDHKRGIPRIIKWIDKDYKRLKHLYL